jgi:hypothetical protein
MSEALERERMDSESEGPVNNPKTVQQTITKSIRNLQLLSSETVCLSRYRTPMAYANLLIFIIVDHLYYEIRLPGTLEEGAAGTGVLYVVAYPHLSLINDLFASSMPVTDGQTYGSEGRKK